MRRDLEKYLIKKFPLCFGDIDKGPRESLMCFGLECGNGWYKIIKEACQKAEIIIAKWIDKNKDDKNFNKDWTPRLSQVKEKYGTLRMYWSSYPKGLDKVEMEAERKSAKTCEQCGKSGKLRGQGWYYTSCFIHAKEQDRDNLEIVEDAYEKRRKIMGKLLGELLEKFAVLLYKFYEFVRELSLKLQFPLKVVDVSEETVENLFPHSFTTFKEGMASKDYCTRHDAAAKLVGWYLHHNGTPFIEDLVRAAEVLLEDTLATSKDVSYLVGAWKDQASAITDEDREKAVEREYSIYAKVAAIK